MTQPTPAYTPPPAQPGSYQPVVKKPPLSGELKRTASVAGAVSFTMMSIGWGLASTAVGIGLFAGFFVWILGVIGATEEGRDLDYLRLTEFIETINLGAWVVPLIIAGLVGVGLWVWALFVSRGMLARKGHPSPWGVTWAGTGIAIAASWFVSWIAWLPMQLIGFIAPDAFTSFESGVTITIVLAVVSFVLSIAVSAVLGWLAWWWMAHAMRPGTTTA
jgi:hypothetical protein